MAPVPSFLILNSGKSRRFHLYRVLDRVVHRAHCLLANHLLARHVLRPPRRHHSPQELCRLLPQTVLRPQHVSTLVRQLVFDVIFVVENIVLITIALNSNVKELHEGKIMYIRPW